MKYNLQNYHRYDGQNQQCFRKDRNRRKGAIGIF